MSAKERTKGATGERELAKILRDELGAEITRNLVQSREGGADLLGVPGWAIECKRAADKSLNRWWLQACQQADRAGMKPALIYRIDRCDWRVIVAMRHLFPSFECHPIGITWTVEMSLPAWCAVVREEMVEATKNPLEGGFIAPVAAG